MESLRLFCARQELRQEIVYDRTKGWYRLENPTASFLTNSQIFAVCKILLDSRSMCRDEMLPILDKLVACCVPEGNRRAVTGLLSNEKYHYIEPHHRKPILPGLWKLGLAVREHRVLEERFQVPYKDRFQEGEFRKRVQFMYGGKLQRLRFRYTGLSIEAVLDRLPTAEIVERDEQGWTVEAEVFGKGIEMWLRSLGEYVTRVERDAGEGP